MSTPAHKIRRGVLQVTIWRNTATRAPGTASSPAAATSRATMPGRRPTASRHDDLLPMAKLLDLADTWIMHQQQADAKARKEQAESADRRLSTITSTGRASDARPSPERNHTMPTIDIHARGPHNRLCDLIEDMAAGFGGRLRPRARRPPAGSRRTPLADRPRSERKRTMPSSQYESDHHHRPSPQRRRRSTLPRRHLRRGQGAEGRAARSASSSRSKPTAPSSTSTSSPPATSPSAATLGAAINTSRTCEGHRSTRQSKKGVRGDSCRPIPTTTSTAAGAMPQGS